MCVEAEKGGNELVDLKDLESVDDSISSEGNSYELMVLEDRGSDLELVEVNTDDDKAIREHEGNEWPNDLPDDNLENETNIEHEEEALHDGAPITISASYLMLFFYAKKFDLTLEGFQGLLKVVSHHCHKPNKCASSVYKFKRIFSKTFGNVENHKNLCYCLVCCNYIENDGSV